MVVSVVSGGRTHLALYKDGTYLGSVNSYNNCLTGGIARICGVGKRVLFYHCGHSHVLNKTSYQKLANQCGERRESIRYFLPKDIANVYSFQNRGKLHENIEESTKNKLSYKMAKAIKKGDTQKALKMLEQGADPHQEYYDLGKYGVSYAQEKPKLPNRRFEKKRIFYAPPILHAAQQANAVVVKKLIQYGASTEVFGKSYFLSRTTQQIIRGHPKPPLTENDFIVYNVSIGSYLLLQDRAESVSYWRLSSCLNLKLLKCYDPSLIEKWLDEVEEPYLYFDLYVIENWLDEVEKTRLIN